LGLHGHHTMLRLAVRLALLASVSGAVACTENEDLARYLDDARFRRATLMTSLVNPDNGYSRLRLSCYATGAAGDWDALPAWNPPVATLDSDGNALNDELSLDLSSADDPVALRVLGERAFYRYPVQLYDQPIADAALVQVRLPDGGVSTALTCASCHTRLVDGVVTAGLANEAIDLGWGPGLVDVAPPPGEPAVAIPDLRAASLEKNWQRDGAVRNDGWIALALRIETLIITSHGQLVRPPREVPLALAAWVESLAPPWHETDGRGATLFEARCAGCHAPPDFAGPPVALAVVGTDPAVGLSADRGTGGYRVPSLRGVGRRGRLLHDASVPDVATLLDPTRTAPGHVFGFDLPSEDRAALVAWVETL
jgi:mono/diheme cytochrome c family protein